ncbi:hypothetical protein [Pseudovibrio sp. POLY-S9]|uniref:5'-methylthioadenosine/S-adenosylhomocysteine nucleosidase family protein n=1 Tax=Pseudovibrio sp. POLY-S9 TaxID=1576596 RepID=UPI00070B19F0|nr:hypothetical protein [Pseudovibrio sp. POLY-S9]
MKVLILEDNNNKYDKIQKVILDVDDKIDIVRTSVLGDAVRLIYEQEFALLVLDLMVPRFAGDAPINVSDELIFHVSGSKNKRTNVVAISGFRDIVEQRRAEYNEAGIVLLHYKEDDEQCLGALDLMIQRLKFDEQYRFLIVCALEKERSSFRKTDAEVDVRKKNLDGLDCQPVKIGSERGLILLLPRMGMIDASIITTRAIDRFKPEIVVMSGICAGMQGRSKPGNLLAADITWDYQTGKVYDGATALEPYQVPIDNNLRTTISNAIEDKRLLRKLAEDIADDLPVSISGEIGPVVSGSAVIASEEKMKAISETHRKMVGLDMELYGVYRACALASEVPKFFGVKVVVDQGDKSKSDDFQTFGSIFSARFVTHLLEIIFEGGNTSERIKEVSEG